jgi:hypothetical protein
MEYEGNCRQEKSFGDDGAHNPLQIQVKEKCVLDAVLMAFRGHFQFVNVRKKLRGFKNPLHAAAENVYFVRGLEHPCYLAFNICGTFSNTGKGLRNHTKSMLYEIHVNSPCLSLSPSLSLSGSPNPIAKSAQSPPIILAGYSEPLALSPSALRLH